MSFIFEYFIDQSIDLYRSNQNLNSILPILGLYLVTSFKLVPSLMKILSIIQQIKGLQPSINILDEEFKNFKKRSKLKKLLVKDRIIF